MDNFHPTSQRCRLSRTTPTCTQESSRSIWKRYTPMNARFFPWTKIPRSNGRNEVPFSQSAQVQSRNRKWQQTSPTNPKEKNTSPNRSYFRVGLQSSFPFHVRINPAHLVEVTISGIVHEPWLGPSGRTIARFSSRTIFTFTSYEMSFFFLIWA